MTILVERAVDRPAPWDPRRWAEWRADILTHFGSVGRQKALDAIDVALDGMTSDWLQNGGFGGVGVPEEHR